MDRGAWWARMRCVALGISAAALLSGVAFAAPAEKIAISSATWNAEKAELKVQGVSRHIDGVVLLRDASTKKLLGSAAVRGDGKWLLKVRDPAVLPARMRAEVEGVCAECAVQPWTDPAAVAAAAPAETPPAR